jgi:exopolysaccharide biosynthesis polyprenyl glycosylphosphotransferase
MTKLGPTRRLTGRLTPVGAQRAIDVVAFRLAPAATAGLLAYAHVREVKVAVLVGLAILLGIHVTSRIRYPMHLMPAGRVALGVGGPILGALIALGVDSLGGSILTVADVVVPVTGTWVVMAVGAAVSDQVKSDRPVRVAFIGRAETALLLVMELAIARVRAFEVVGWIGPRESNRSVANQSLAAGLTWLGPLDKMRTSVLGHDIDLLVYEPAPGNGMTQTHLLEEAATACLDLPVRMLDANQLYEELLGHVPIGTIDAAWFRYIMHPRYRPTPPLSKRLLDVALVSVAGLVVLPAVAIAAAAIKLESRGPVLYRQRRVGANGREFEMLKLRTMPPDAEPDGSPQWSSAADQRATRVGRVLRRLHVDELPQLWNVLRGEMTLVGPRPERPELVAGLERQFPHYERRHLVKPGITGWAQIRCGYAGSEMGAAWKLCHDLYYLKHRSLLADVLLMVETFVNLPRDAYRYLRAPNSRYLMRPAPEA